jgi:hypothetical protein
MNEKILVDCDLIGYNIDIQINTMIELCKDNPSLQLCRNVVSNTYENWYTYFTKDNNKNLFSKGFERLDTWKQLFKYIPSVYFSKEIIPKTPQDIEAINKIINKLTYLKNNNKFIYFFIFSSLIIIFQVFGNGNHRTAQYFMKSNQQCNISEKQMKRINLLLNCNDYYVVKNNPIQEMSKLITSLIKIAELK